MGSCRAWICLLSNLALIHVNVNPSNVPARSRWTPLLMCTWQLLCHLSPHCHTQLDPPGIAAERCSALLGKGHSQSSMQA